MSFVGRAGKLCDRRGVVLITALLFVILVGMLTRAIVRVGPASLTVAERARWELSARGAAEAGLNYARARLLEDQAWRGNLNELTVNRPDFAVLEDSGCVIGLLRTPDGHTSQFRLRFNYQDGPLGADGLPDPDPANRVPLVYVCRNNLLEDAETVVPRADPRSFQVTAPNAGPVRIPGRSVYLVVEGRSGPGLDRLSAAAPNAPARGQVTAEVVESTYQLIPGQQVVDAPIMGAGDVVFDVSKQLDVRPLRKGNDPTRIRSKQGVRVLDQGATGLLNLNFGEIWRDPRIGFVGLTRRGNVVSEKDERLGDGRDFYNLKWSDVARADSSPGTASAVQIPAGTYVHWFDGKLHYYDMTFEEYQAYMADPAHQSDRGLALSEDLREVRSAANLNNVKKGVKVVNGNRWDIRTDLCVLPSATGRRDFSVIPPDGTEVAPGDSTYLVPLGVPVDPRKLLIFDMEKAIVSCPGKTILFGNVAADNATLTTEGDLVIAANSLAMKDTMGNGGQAAQLNIYARQDVFLTTYWPRWGGDNNISLNGVVYAWGNFKAVAGSPLKRQDFYLRGALVAYGSDPQSGEPGGQGSGRIDVTAAFASVVFDPSKVVNLSKPQALPTRLTRRLYVVH